MSKKKFDSGIFENSSPDIHEIDEKIFGTGLGQTAGKRITGKPVDIHKLWADRTQPRRTVPLSIRGDWDGSAEAVPALLDFWADAVKKEHGKYIQPHLVVRGMLEAPIEYDEKTEPLTAKFMSLLQLAGSIKREGLLNPIQIHKKGDRQIVVAGERRWWAHHVLYRYDDDVDQWAMIPAVEVGDNYRYIQATENGRRDPLNAIGMARQLALLIMDMYADEVDFKSFDEATKNQSTDRLFYAQVADGTDYRIKRGYGDRILEATGLPNTSQISRYRNLLTLDDKNWSYADENDWTEGRCRRILNPEQFKTKEGEDLDTLPIGNISPRNADTSTTVDISQNNLQTGQGYSQPYQPSTPAPSRMDAIPTGGSQIAVGQFRVRSNQETFPYIEIDREFPNNDWRIIMNDASGPHQQMISATSIYKYYPVVLKRAPERPTTNSIVVGQIRTKKRHEDNGSYIVVLDALESGSWMVEFNHPPTNTKDTRKFGTDQIESGWSVLLDSRPQTRTDEAIKQNANIDLMGYNDPEYTEHSTVEFEDGRRQSQYQNPETTNQEPWDTPQRKPVSGGADQVPLITTYQTVSRIINNLQTISVFLNMQNQNTVLREMQMMTPARLKQIHDNGGDQAIHTLADKYAIAIQTITNEIINQSADFIFHLGMSVNVDLRVEEGE